MSTGYSWEGIRQVCVTLLGARHVPERLCGGRVYLGRYIKCSTFTFTFTFLFKERKFTKSKHFPKQIFHTHCLNYSTDGVKALKDKHVLSATGNVLYTKAINL